MPVRKVQGGYRWGTLGRSTPPKHRLNVREGQSMLPAIRMAESLMLPKAMIPR